MRPPRAIKASAEYGLTRTHPRAAPEPEELRTTTNKRITEILDLMIPVELLYGSKTEGEKGCLTYGKGTDQRDR